MKRSIVQRPEVIAALFGLVGAGVSYFSDASIAGIETNDSLRNHLLYIPERAVLHSSALGDDGLAADLLWLRSVFYIGDNDLEDKQLAKFSDLRTKVTGVQNRPPGVSFDDQDFRQDPSLQSLLFWNDGSNDLPQLFPLVNRVTELDPAFVTPYIHGAMNLAMYAGRYSEARYLLDRAVINCPGRWEPSYYRGFLRLFYANDKLGAVDDITTAARTPGAPIIVIQLAAALQVGAGMKDQTIQFLTSLRGLTDEPELKKKIDDMLAVYGKGVKVERAAQTNQVTSMLDSLLHQ